MRLGLCASVFLSCVSFLYLLSLGILYGPFPNQVYKHHVSGAVASECRRCTQIGIDLLKAGGNAADAVSSESPALGTEADRGVGGRDDLLRRCHGDVP